MDQWGNGYPGTWHRTLEDQLRKFSRRSAEQEVRSPSRVENLKNARPQMEEQIKFAEEALGSGAD